MTSPFVQPEVRVKSPVRVLLVDDCPADRLLARRELQRVFTNLHCEEIDQPSTLKRALQTPPDLVITDYQIGWTDGIAVLRNVRQSYPHCPVIMFTGTGSEEIAVEAMKSGLDDYVLKSPRHYIRLAATARATLERKQSEQRATLLEIRLQSLLNRLDVGVFRARADGTILEANPAFLKLVGRAASPAETLLLRNLYLKEGDFDRVLGCLRTTGHVRDYRVQFRRADGAPIWVSMTQSLECIGEGENDSVINGLVEDISGWLEMENQLQQSQRLESVGRLAAGVAHDFNNIVTIIQGYASLLETEVKPGSEGNEFLKNVCSAADRAAGLTRQLLSFSRKQVMQLKVLDLSHLIADVSRLLRCLLGESITLKTHCAENLPLVHVDPGLIEQAIMSLADNARDAMPGGGELAITTSIAEIDTSYTQRTCDARKGTFVCLTISDTGAGMDREMLDRVFEPFFTTKEAGKGTGLALAAVHGIVQQHKGWVEVTSELARGTTFKLFLPVAENEEGAIATDRALPSSLRGHETVLLVEDEPALRKLVRDHLIRNGYRVLEASCGRTALQIWEEQAGKVDLLLTDLKMPEGISGVELAEAFRSRNPVLRVLYTSGYGETLTNQNLEIRRNIRFLQKPYDSATLLQSVRQSLDAETTGS